MGAARGNTDEWAWHVHHEMLYEKLIEPLQKRIDYVKGNKFDDPTLRLKLMRVVEDQQAMVRLDKALKDAHSRYDKALDKAKKLSESRKSSQADIDAANTDAEKAYHEVVMAEEGVMDLHRKECEPDCPWTGVTILAATAKV